MKNYVSIKCIGAKRLAVSTLLCMLAVTPGVSFAQSPVPTSTPNNLQPQAGATQQSANTQNQVGTLQNNNGSSVLSQSGRRPLGVVSSPSQANPTTVVAPSSTSKTDVTSPRSKSYKTQILLAIGALSVALAGIYLVRRSPSSQNRPKTEQDEIVSQKPAIKPEPLPVSSPKKSRKQQRRKKKRKSHQR